MKHTLLVLAIIANSMIFAQVLKCDFSPSEGPKYDYFGSYNYGVVAEDDKYFYAMMDFAQKRDSKTLTISQYDKLTLAIIKTQEIQPAFKSDKKVLVHSVRNIGGQLYFFQVKASNNGVLVYAQKIGDDLKLNAETKCIDTLDITVTEDKGDDFVLSRVAIKSSSKSTKMAIYIAYNELSDKKDFAFKIFDKDLNTITKKKISLPNKGTYFNLQDFVLEESADVILLGKYTASSLKETKNEPLQKATYCVFQVKKDYKKVLEQELAIEGKSLKYIGLHNDEKNNRLVLGGFYATEDLGVNGSFFIFIDKSTFAISTKNSKAFPANFLSKTSHFIGVDAENKYTIDKIVLNENDEPILFAELYYEIIMVKENFSTYTTTYQHDVIVVAADKNGLTKWSVKLPKPCLMPWNYALNPQYISLISNDKIYVSFMEDKKHLTAIDGYEVDKVMQANVKLTPILVTIDKNGKATKARFFSDPKDKTHMDPTLSAISSIPNTIYNWHYNFKKKNIQYRKISLK
jgi:hypothetical protein